LVARLLWEQDAVGSNPVTPIFLLQKNAEIVHDNDLGVLFLAIDPNGRYIRKSLTAIISLLLPNPEWEGVARTKLANSEVRGIVDSIVSEILTAYFAARPDIADAIIAKAIKAAEIAEIARKERELIHRRSNENKHHT
jgi:DNA gyrase/topoisomerase IV subunit B